MSTKAAQRALRRRVREEALAAIGRLSDVELKNMRHELGRLLALKANEMNDLRQRLEAIKLEFERRQTATPAGLHISDHALVRYLERVKGIDIASVRAEIGELAMAAKAARGGRRGVARNGDLVIGINDVDGCVTTVYSERELVVVDEVA